MSADGIAVRTARAGSHPGPPLRAVRTLGAVRTRARGSVSVPRYRNRNPARYCPVRSPQHCSSSCVALAPDIGIDLHPLGPGPEHLDDFATIEKWICVAEVLNQGLEETVIVWLVER